jgi:hypothetical protein
MSALVPPYRVAIRTADVLAGASVRGPTWIDCAHLANWVLGRGANVLPGCAPIASLAPATDYALKWRVKPNYQAVERFWWLHIQSTANDPSDVDITIPDTGAAETRRAQVDANAAWPVEVREVLSAQSAAEAELTAKLNIADGGDLYGIGAWEIPRAELVFGGTDLGSEPSYLFPGSPIAATPLAGIVAATADDSVGRRASLVQWAVPVTAGGSTTTAFAFSTTSATWVDIWALPVPVLARKLGRSDTTGTITAKVLAWASDGSTGGDVRLSGSRAGAGSSTTIGSTTTPTWSAAFTLDVDADDLTASDGRRSSAWEELDVQIQRTSGSGTLYVASASIWED